MCKQKVAIKQKNNVRGKAELQKLMVAICVLSRKQTTTSGKIKSNPITRMKLIKNNAGINIRATLSTLEVGDTISLKETDVKVDYVRTQACKTARANNWTIEVANSKDLKGKVIIRRTK